MLSMLSRHVSARVSQRLNLRAGAKYLSTDSRISELTAELTKVKADRDMLKVQVDNLKMDLGNLKKETYEHRSSIYQEISDVYGQMNKNNFLLVYLFGTVAVTTGIIKYLEEGSNQQVAPPVGQGQTVPTFRKP